MENENMIASSVETKVETTPVTKRRRARLVSQTVSEFLADNIKDKSIRGMLAHRGVQTDVVKAMDGDQNRHLVNTNYAPLELIEGRVIMPGESFCKRGSRAFTKTGARKKGVTCEGCLHRSRALLARKMLNTR